MRNLSITFLALSSLIAFSNCATYSINLTDPIWTVNERFLSVALDTWLTHSVDLQNPNFSPLVKHLSPMYLRVGGTTADSAIFDEAGTGNSTDAFYITGDFWLSMADFAKNSNVRLLIDLNSLLRDSDGNWDSSNAEELINFSEKNGIELEFELGNEPDLYQAIYGKFVHSYTLSDDYKHLREILDNTTLYKDSLLVGPSMFDVGSSQTNKDYLTSFLSNASSTLSAVTYHQYYFNGRDATEELFLNPSTFNYLEQRTKVVTEIVNNRNKVWLGETSSCYNQGAAGFSDRFLASFLWLDKLGLGAKLGLDVIIRQTIWGYNYPILNSAYEPNTDYWVSVLYKKLVGTKVLEVSNDGDDSSTVRIYAHCAKSDDLWGDNAVVVFGMNFGETEQTVQLGDGFIKGTAYNFELTSESDLYSSKIRLNGEVLEPTENMELPELTPNIVEISDNFTIPARSLGFLVLADVNASACQ